MVTETQARLYTSNLFFLTAYNNAEKLKKDWCLGAHDQQARARKLKKRQMAKKLQEGSVRSRQEALGALSPGFHIPHFSTTQCLQPCFLLIAGVAKAGRSPTMA